MLGPVGMLVHATSNDIASSEDRLSSLCMANYGLLTRLG